MARAAYQQSMKDRIQDLDFAIGEIRHRLAATDNGREKVELTTRLSGLERRREQMAHWLTMLEGQPDNLWSNVRAQIELEWFGLVQDFEERVGRLR